jgi:hypothetical protein
MTQSIIDIFFLQQLINNGFKKGIFLFITDLPSFVNGKKKEDIYSYFRSSKPLSQFGCQDIPLFMLKKKNPAVQKLYSLLYSKKIELRKDYKIQFENFDKNGHSYYYFLLTVSP